MKCLFRCAQLRCLTGRRPYSFASDLHALLSSFENQGTRPQKSELRTFHKDVPHASTISLIRRYKALQKTEDVLLPEETAILFIQRLLREDKFDAAATVLLNYDLNRSVTLAVSSLQGSDKSAYTQGLFKAFLSVDQAGLANQLLAECGYTKKQQQSMRNLIAVQQSIHSSSNLTKTETEICRHNEGKFDDASLLLLTQRAIDLGDTSYATALIDRYPHPKAIHILLQALPSEAYAIYTKLKVPLLPETWPIVINAATTTSQLQRLSPNEPFLIARKALSLDIEYASELIQSLDPTQAARIVLLLDEPTPINKYPDPVGLLEAYLQKVSESTVRQYHTYPFSKLLQVFQAIDQRNVDIPPSLQSTMTLHVLHRPPSEILEFMRLKMLTFKSIRGLVNHLLRASRLQTQDVSTQFFVDVLQLDRPATETYELYLMILQSLAHSDQCYPFLKATRQLSPRPDDMSHLIRSLAHHDRHDLILYLMQHYTMTYDIYARYITRMSTQSLPVALRAFRMMRKKFKPRERLLQNMALRIASNEQMPDSRAFRYLTLLISIARSHRIPFDRVFLSSLLRAVLLRQGLGASSTRVAYLLDRSAMMAGKSRSLAQQHDELLSVLGQWKQMAKESPGMSDSRPRRLRELIDGIGLRSSVIRNPK